MEAPLMYWVMIGGQSYGPKSLEQMQAAIRSGEIGRKHDVSIDSEIWQAAENFPELFHEETEPETETETETETGLGLGPSPGPGPGPVPPQTQVNILGLAGFICSVTGLTLSFGPLLIFLLESESAYFLVPLAFPLFLLSVTGLVLSLVGMMQAKRIFATTGMIVGIVGTLVGLITILGWLIVDPPADRWVNEIIRTAQTDIERAEIDFEQDLDAYRNPDGKSGLSQDEQRDYLTRSFMSLVRAYDTYVTGTAVRMSKFRTAFRKLNDLRVAYEQYREAIKLREDMEPVEAIERVGDRIDPLKFLLDLLVLYQNRQITIEQAQSKFRAVRAVR